MSGVTDATLLAYLADALDEGSRREVEESLSSEPDLVQRLTTLGADLARPGRPRWRLPPDGWWPPLGTPRPQPTLASRSTVWEVPVQGEPDQVVVLLERVDGDWRVFFPQHVDDLLRLGDLQPEGEAWLLPLRQVEAAQALVLAPEDLVRQGLEVGWQELQQALADGSLPCRRFTLG